MGACKYVKMKNSHLRLASYHQEFPGPKGWSILFRRGQAKKILRDGNTNQDKIHSIFLTYGSLSAGIRGKKKERLTAENRFYINRDLTRIFLGQVVMHEQIKPL